MFGALFISGLSDYLDVEAGKCYRQAQTLYCRFCRVLANKCDIYLGLQLMVGFQPYQGKNGCHCRV